MELTMPWSFVCWLQFSKKTFGQIQTAIYLGMTMGYRKSSVDLVSIEKGTELSGDR